MIRILFFLLLISTISLAQRPSIDSLGKYSDGRALERVEANKKIVVDSAKKVSFIKKILKTDSAQKNNIPRKVLLRSLILPGWGQATNKQYWVIPIVYAAAAGGIYSIIWNNNKYKFYKGYLANFVIDGITEVEINGRGPFTQAQIEPAVKAYHRQRDLSYIAMALGWTLQAVQANVSAHLKGFDMSEDISLKIEPSIQPSSFGNAVGVKIGLNF
jgi:Family of unknown function (DUF5683)